MTALDEATERQHQAARPRSSTWLSANAGSGKTRVLTDRVARLLLDGVDPQNILCLTYTKAAANEMQNRLFGRLGEWAMLNDPELRAALARIGVEGVADLSSARTLFARALETPGGLKIQTIHSFCSSILRRFPLEAGVSPQFTEIDETAAARLMAEVAEEVALSSPAAFDAAARYFSGDGIEGLAAQIVAHQDAFPGGVTPAVAKDMFRLPATLTPESLAAQVFTKEFPVLLSSLCDALASGSTTDLRALDRLTSLLDRSLRPADLLVLEDLCLTKSGANPFTAKIGKFPTKAVRAALGDLTDDLDGLMRRVEGARQTRLSLHAADKTAALHAFADAFIPAYRAAKRRRGWLDFNDLIRKTKVLLQDSTAAAWVLYRLDGGIDHILVDEAQDTSPAQWEVIAALAQEMTSGQGARPDVSRTVFVVGDKKQSIYSFQGADPRAFDDMFTHFRNALSTQGGLARLQLRYSFRSSRAVLQAVDTAYANSATGDREEGQNHEAFHDGLPGRVDLWPVIEPQKKEKPEHWWDPVDLKGANHHHVRLARNIAGFIARTIDTETIPTVDRDGHIDHRPIHAGDFLILVQGRKTGLFHNIIAACKAAGLPVAGADRLRLAAELAVKDVLSLLRFLALPEDDLALAEALRSPLFGWSEQDLFRLGNGRSGYLWSALRARRDTHPDTLETLDRLRRHADFLRPYELIEAILTDTGGRERLLARLGAEIEDGLDELLNQALAYERSAVPSLSGFLAALESGDVEIKRQAESAGRQIRVMTVHGAKGLESPIVILPDTLKQDRERQGDILLDDQGRPLWKTPKAEDPDVIAAARERAARADREERKRLLYVAMTRAEKWLVVCGAGERRATSGCWYDDIEVGVMELGADPVDTPTGTGIRLSRGRWAVGDLLGPAPDTETGSVLPPWARQVAPPAPHADRPLNPSDLGGAKVLIGDGAGLDGDAARLRGTRLHRLLEHLPRYLRKDWAVMSEALIGSGQADLAELMEEAARVLDDPALSHLFTETALAEVPIAASLGERRLLGTIDRLLIAPDAVLAVDFKSNPLVPDAPDEVPDGILRQMGAYATALAQVYPDRRIDTAILWTQTAKLMPLPHELVTQALSAVATP